VKCSAKRPIANVLYRPNSDGTPEGKYCFDIFGHLNGISYVGHTTLLAAPLSEVTA
jgi:hypothetical protein